jgi:hypothetical protein
MITYLKSKTERLEKGCIDKCDAGCRNWSERCPTCQAKLSTLIKTSWIFARKTIIEIIDNTFRNLSEDNILLEESFHREIMRLKEIISYCEAKAKEHKIDLEDGK